MTHRSRTIMLEQQAKEARGEEERLRRHREVLIARAQKAKRLIAAYRKSGFAGCSVDLFCRALSDALAMSPEEALRPVHCPGEFQYMSPSFDGKAGNP